PGGDVSLYDNHTWVPGAARAVEYHADADAGTATLVWQHRTPDGRHSDGTGGFRRYAGGTDNLITWGLGMRTLFTVVDAKGRVLLEAAFPDGEAAYRTLKAPAAEF